MILLQLAGMAKARASDWYVDGIDGDNRFSGMSVKEAWRDFSHINGMTLQPGDRVRLRRGSVFHQELRMTAAGTEHAWVQIGAYGTGARPILSRGGEIDQSCCLLVNPDNLVIEGLAFGQAGRGLVVQYRNFGHGGLEIRDCVFRHIEGIYKDGGKESAVPEWRSYLTKVTDSPRMSAGLAVMGKADRVHISDCDFSYCSWGFLLMGKNLLVDRVYVHDCVIPYTSPHPGLIDVKDSELRNCVFDGAGFNASAGTMGLFVAFPERLTLRGCVFTGQPDSGVPDEGGVDFEAGGDGCTIEDCTFLENAGAAIEVLGLKRQQTRNILVKDSRFIRDNFATKLGPSEIFVWGGGDARICSSTGRIENNSFVLRPGVAFFKNEAAGAKWTLGDNRSYSSLKELKTRHPFNLPPVVSTGADLVTDQTHFHLHGAIDDPDGGPAESSRWEQLDGPGVVTFADSHSPSSDATVSADGSYTLRLVANDGQYRTSDDCRIHVWRDRRIVEIWDFEDDLNSEGWTVNFDDGAAPPSTGTPRLNQVSGGALNLAVERTATLESPAIRAVGVGATVSVVVRMRNHTGADTMSLALVGDGGGEAVDFPVMPRDDEFREYRISLTMRMRRALERGGRLTLKVNASGQAGALRVDYVAVVERRS